MQTQRSINETLRQSDRSIFRRTAFFLLTLAATGLFSVLLFGLPGGLASIMIGAGIFPVYGIWWIELPNASTRQHRADYHKLNIAELGISEADYLKDSHKRAVANAERGAGPPQPLPLLISLLLTAIWLAFLGWYFAI